MMGVQRIFLGWDGPLLPAAADWLGTRSTDDDLSGFTVVVPVRRAGRRLLELLIERASRHDGCLSPPRIVAPAELASALHESPRPAAPNLVRRQVWLTALQSLSADIRQEFLPRPPRDGDLAGWIALADLLLRLHDELSGHSLSMSDVAARLRGADSAVGREPARWQALSEAQRAYLARLEELGLCDAPWERRAATTTSGVESHIGHLVLVGVVELPRATQRLVRGYPGPSTALLYAPQSCHEQFDDLGLLVPARWLNVAAPVTDEQIHIVEGPRQQVEAVLDAIRALDGRYSVEQIVIGVADASLVPFLEEELPPAGVPVRYAQGTSLARSSPGRLLQSLEACLRRDSFDHWAALVRHPEFGPLLVDAGRADPATTLDRYFENRLPAALESGGIVDASAQRIRERCHTELRELRGGERPLSHWAEPLIRLLARVFGRRPRQRMAPRDQTVIEACDALQSALADMHGLDPRLSPRVSAADAVAWLLAEVGSQPLPPTRHEPAVEVIGWLDLPTDDAEALIVVGCNEGFVPDSINGHLFLSDAVRGRLGLPDNNHRLARELYHLTAMTSWRRPVALIAGQTGSDREPLRPSRLLLAADAVTIARRLTSNRSTAPRLRPEDTPIAHDPITNGSPRVPNPLGPWPIRVPAAELPESLSVTAFRDYLASPYRFALKHVLKLRPLADDAQELDAASFGSLLHRTLQVLMTLSPEELRDPDTVKDALHVELHRVVAERFGERCLPAVRVQVEQARQRLDAFAMQQAAWAAQGWEIKHVEWDAVKATRPVEGVESNSPTDLLEVDGKPFGLKARIDRVDYNAAENRWMVLDYKSGDKPKTPDAQHLDRQRNWLDLQLPLYRYLAARRGLAGRIDVGYALLPKGLDQSAIVPADWDEATLAAAVECACDVVRAIRNGVFPLGDTRPAFPDEFSDLCHDGMLRPVLREDDEEVAEE